MDNVQYLIKRKQLRDRIRACRSCPLGEKCRSPVPFSGPTPAAIAVVGEAPGAQEDRYHAPFIGPSGRILRESFRRNGLDDEQVAYLNAVSCWPKRTPTADEVLECRPNLIDQLDLIEPTHVLLLGAVALSSWFPKLKFREYRGQWWREPHNNDRWYFSTWHPAYVLRRPQAIPEFDHDIFRFVDEGWRRRSQTSGVVLTIQPSLLAMGDD